MLLIALKHNVLGDVGQLLARIAHAINSVETNSFVMLFPGRRVLRMLSIALNNAVNTGFNLISRYELKRFFR